MSKFGGRNEPVIFIPFTYALENLRVQEPHYSSARLENGGSRKGKACCNGKSKRDEFIHGIMRCECLGSNKGAEIAEDDEMVLFYTILVLF